MTYLKSIELVAQVLLLIEQLLQPIGEYNIRIVQSAVFLIKVHVLVLVIKHIILLIRVPLFIIIILDSLVILGLLLLFLLNLFLGPRAVAPCRFLGSNSSYGCFAWFLFWFANYFAILLTITQYFFGFVFWVNCADFVVRLVFLGLNIWFSRTGIGFILCFFVFFLVLGFWIGALRLFVFVI